MPRPSPKLVWPLAILAVGVVAIALLVATRPDVELKPPAQVTPLVRVIEAEPTDWRFVVHSQGTVEPRNESELVPQVAGEVEWISPALASGGFFRPGEALVRIEDADYRVALTTARAALARASSESQRAQNELVRQTTLKEKGVASEARFDDASNAASVAAAALDEAKALVDRAERDLERTVLRAAFEGRVRSERVDVGQFVNRGESIATLYSVDFVEVSLPLPDRELRYVDVPRAPKHLRAATTENTATEDAVPDRGPEVVLRAEFAGSEQTWLGRVVRTAGEIDPQTRMVRLVARVADPYGLHAETEPVPLAVGLFVRAEIQGRTAHDVFVLPRAALRSGNPMDPDASEEVHVVDAEGRLHIRPVEVLRTEPEVVVIGTGLAAGDRVSISPLRAVVEGMRVRVAGDGAPAEPVAADPTEPDAAQAAAAEAPAS